MKCFFRKLSILVVSFSLISTNVIFATTTTQPEQNLISKNVKSATTTTQPEQKLKSKGFKEVTSIEWNEATSKTDALPKNKTKDGLDISKGKTIIQNNGNPIKTNMLSKKDGNELFAVTTDIKNGISYKTYYFANTESIDMNDVLKKIDDASETISPESASLLASTPVGTGSLVHIFNYSNYAIVSGVKRVISTLTENIEFTRKSDNTMISTTADTAKVGSIWDITATSQLAIVYSPLNIASLSTNLNVNWSNENLLSYSPKVTSGTVSIGLAGILPTFNYAFPSGPFNIIDRSSTANKYGDWLFTSKLYPKVFNTKPAVRVTNTSGNLALSFKHTITIQNGPSFSSGAMTVYVPDRNK
ncbi:hypothetical protein [Clostridium estertheticum]|uniref:Uncharacterized protein n=1 Tax=Clostridium estertheticum subsp. estertheticum TaxID=1552 RepID=A0A1J0GPJ6_9CLOT|nr:hypothetical protein [Clostridium estertheticum]APC42824.1 hypothetical protein A7L45_22050 [Clostridium estertheticum subsp. estertheticum]